ncbi:serine/threonine-protein kinase Pkn1 [Abditibacteriota bacterium]|nr:serine/threonine-protein kinase Pkn1 [Abditibacteriota bacterium]
MIVCPTCSSPNPDGALTCSRCGSPLGGATAAPNRYPMALPPGTKLNNNSFSIGRVLGQGGFGITYKGNDINLARLVAIKELFPDGSRRQEKTVVPPHNVSPGEWDITRREFIEEARTVAKFSHPGIVNVYFVWEENGTAYQAMEFLDGQSAGALVEKGKLSENEAIPIIERVADALETMHASGFIHRDLKPDNIVQTKDGRTVLIDFGTAKQFVREKTQKLNPVLTPGYAPLEQYSSQARFDHRLDIYALGATLYHLLTGEIPVSAVERAAGVDLPSVRDKNPLVSVAVSEAVERAMAVKVGDRFESVREFARALRSTKQTPAPQPQSPRNVAPKPSNSPAPAPPSQLDANNPYLSQIRALNEGLKAAPSPLSFPGQARMDSLERELKAFAGFIPPGPMNCPSCRQNTVKSVSGNYAGACPFDGTQLTRIEWPIGKCAVCRAGTLQFHSLGAGEFMCAVCRRAAVRIVQRPSFLGLLSVAEFECPACRAQYVPIGSNAARLKQVEAQYGQTPLLGQTCTFAQWNDAANATGLVADCPNCQAHFIEQKNSALTLANWRSDPYGVGQSMGGQTLSPERWAQLAAGAGQDTSSHRCPTCHAHWNVDLNGQSLTLLRANAPEQERMRKWGFSLAQPYPIKRWLAKAAGKVSGEPGRVCSNCRTEFDSRPGLEMFALVSAHDSLLQGRSTQILSWSDWHRITQKLPLSGEERVIRDEVTKLTGERDAEIARQNAFTQNKRRDLNTQLDGLYKRAAIDGFADMGFTVRDAKAGERLLWASRALEFKYRSREGRTYWDQNGLVRFVVSQSRVWVEGGRAHSLTEVQKVEVQYQSRIPLLVIHLPINKRPLGFAIDPTQVDVTIDGLTRNLLFDVHDVSAMLKRLTV